MNTYELMDICKAAGIKNPLPIVQLDKLMGCDGDTPDELRKTVTATFQQVNDMSESDDQLDVESETNLFMCNWDKWVDNGDTHALQDVLDTVYSWTGYSWLREGIDALDNYHKAQV